MKKIIAFVASANKLPAVCGTGKNLTAANARIAGLNGQVETLNTKAGDCDKQVVQLTI